MFDIDIPLLGQPGIDNLELITLKSNSNALKENEPREDGTTSNIVNDFKEVFEGLGQVKGRPVILIQKRMQHHSTYQHQEKFQFRYLNH